MKKYNLEEQLADKLGNRSITPTDNAWERIAFNRQQQAGKKQKKKYGLYMVAAVLLVFLSCGYFVSVMVVNEKPSGVVQQVVQQDENGRATKTAAKKVQQVYSNELSVVAQNEVKQQTAQKLDTPAVNKINMPPAENKVNELPAVMPSTQITTDEVSIKATAPLVAETRPQEEVLLEKAMQDIAMEKQRKAATNDAALLKEVESEMDEYYREKALRFFSLKYKKIRIVVKDNH